MEEEKLRIRNLKLEVRVRVNWKTIILMGASGDSSRPTAGPWPFREKG